MKEGRKVEGIDGLKWCETGGKACKLAVHGERLTATTPL